MLARPRPPQEMEAAELKLSETEDALATAQMHLNSKRQDIQMADIEHKQLQQSVQRCQGQLSELQAAVQVGRPSYSLWACLGAAAMSESSRPRRHG